MRKSKIKIKSTKKQRQLLNYKSSTKVTAKTQDSIRLIYNVKLKVVKSQLRDIEYKMVDCRPDKDLNCSSCRKQLHKTFIFLV